MPTTWRKAATLGVAHACGGGWRAHLRCMMLVLGVPQRRPVYAKENQAAKPPVAGLMRSREPRWPGRTTSGRSRLIACARGRGALHGALAAVALDQRRLDDLAARYPHLRTVQCALRRSASAMLQRRSTPAKAPPKAPAPAPITTSPQRIRTTYELACAPCLSASATPHRPRPPPKAQTPACQSRGSGVAPVAPPPGACRPRWPAKDETGKLLVCNPCSLEAGPPRQRPHRLRRWFWESGGTCRGSGSGVARLSEARICCCCCCCRCCCCCCCE